MKKVIKYSTTLAGASLFLMIISMASRGVGFFREIIFANEFGLSEEFDIYLIASVIPVTTNTIIYFIGQNFFIPNYSDNSESNKFKSLLFLRNTFYSFGFGGIIIGVVYFLFADNIIGLFVNSNMPVNTDAVAIFELFALTIPIASCISIISAYSNRVKRFLPPALSSLGLNISVILFVILINYKIGVMSIAIGYLIGSIGQLIYLFYSSSIKDIIFTNGKVSDWSPKDLVSSSLFIIIIIESVGQFYGIADRFFFNSVSEGSISALNYAQTLVSIPISIIAVPLATTFFSKISNDLNDASFSEFNVSIKNSISITLIIFIPIFFIFQFWGFEIISLLLQRGKFDTVASNKTALALKYLNLGLLFYAIYSIFNKVLYSAKLIKQLLYITLVGILIKIIFNFYLVEYFDFVGLALSTSMSYFFFFSASLIVIVRKYRFKWVIESMLELSVFFINAIISILLSEVLITNLMSDRLIAIMLKTLVFLFIFTINLILIQDSGFKFITDRMFIKKII